MSTPANPVCVAFDRIFRAPPRSVISVYHLWFADSFLDDLITQNPPLCGSTNHAGLLCTSPFRADLTVGTAMLILLSFRLCGRKVVTG